MQIIEYRPLENSSKELPSKLIVSLGEIDYYNNSKKKLNEVTIEISFKKDKTRINYKDLKEVKNALCFSASMSIWNAKKTDIITGGQILDNDDLLFLIARDLNTEKLEFFKLIKDFSQKYHLNNFQAGTLKQSEFLKKNGSRGDFSKDCKTLEKGGLLIDRGYKYGLNWLYRPIDKDDLNKLCWVINYKIIINKNKNDYFKN